MNVAVRYFSKNGKAKTLASYISDVIVSIDEEKKFEKNADIMFLCIEINNNIDEEIINYIKNINNIKRLVFIISSNKIIDNISEITKYINSNIEVYYRYFNCLNEDVDSSNKELSIFCKGIYYEYSGKEEKRPFDIALNDINKYIANKREEIINKLNIDEEEYSPIELMNIRAEEIRKYDLDKKEIDMIQDYFEKFFLHYVIYEYRCVDPRVSSYSVYTVLDKYDIDKLKEVYKDIKINNNIIEIYIKRGTSLTIYNCNSYIEAKNNFKIDHEQYLELEEEYEGALF